MDRNNDDDVPIERESDNGSSSPGADPDQIDDRHDSGNGQQTEEG